jgi:hypothetical protein
MEKRNLIKAILVEAVKRHLAEMPQIKQMTGKVNYLTLEVQDLDFKTLF